MQHLATSALKESTMCGLVNSLIRLCWSIGKKLSSGGCPVTIYTCRMGLTDQKCDRFYNCASLLIKVCPEKQLCISPVSNYLITNPSKILEC